MGSSPRETRSNSKLRRSSQVTKIGQVFLVGFVCLMVFSLKIQASSFKGYEKDPSGEILVMNEAVDEFHETEKDFLIAFSRHSAFYRFPKVPDSSTQIRNFLNKCMKLKASVVVHVDAVTAKVMSIEDPER
jgi:formiminotetrahydrofolate cyclodeaminase